MNNQWILCLIAGIFFGMAPLVGRLSSVNAMMMAVLVAVGTLAATIPVAFSQNYATVGWLYLCWGLLGGLINGIGLLAYYKLVAGANSGLWNVSTVLPITAVIMPVVIVIGGCIIFKEPMTTNRIIGLVLAGLAIFFLNK